MSPESNPPGLFDPVTGVVRLLLYPYYIERLHGYRIKAELTEAGPYRLLSNNSVFVECAGGIDRREFESRLNFDPAIERSDYPAGDIYHVVAETTFGWTMPYFHFKDDCLVAVELQPFDAFDLKDYERVKEAIEACLGAPRKQREWNSFITRLFAWWKSIPIAEWYFDWGRVWIWRAGPDMDVDVSVSWLRTETRAD